MTNRTDNLTRADTTNNIGTPSDGGAAWIQSAGTWGISSNRGYKSAADATWQDCVLQTSTTAVSVQATLAALGVLDVAGLCVRESASTDYILGFISRAASTLAIYKQVAGVFTLLVTCPATITPGTDIYKLKVDDNNTISFYQNGVLVLITSDPTGASNTKHGIVAYNLSTRWSAFTSVDVTALPNLVVPAY